MQTFLPYSDFRLCAECLDNKRLNNQINEATIILKTLLGLYEKGWSNHPATKMWKGSEYLLSEYILECHLEYLKRICPKTRKLNKELIDYMTVENIRKLGNNTPKWLNNKDFHDSRKSNLLRKDKEYYSKFNWDVEDNLEYIWIY